MLNQMQQFHSQPMPPLPPDAPTVPEMGWTSLDGSDAEDIGIRPGSTVYLLNSNPDCRLYVRVKRVYSDDTLLVELTCVRAVQWRVAVEDVALALVPEAAILAEVG